MKYKGIIIVCILAVLFGAAVTGYLACRYNRSAVSQGGEQVPPGWVTPLMETTPWLPFKKNVASEYTAEFPPGSKVVVIRPAKGPEIEIGILPDGKIVVPEGVEAKIYVKRPALIEAQIRPFIGVGGVGPELGVAVAAGIDVVRAWRVNIGVGCLISNEAVSGAAFAAYPLWRNVDLRVGGGYGSAGGVGFAGVTIGIE
jgi:hypothetical protein